MNEIQAEIIGYERGWEQAEDYWRAKEQERIIYKLEHALWPTELGSMNLSDTLLNWNCAKGDNLTAGCINEMAKDIISLIKGENK